jgi:hypothetical protein
VRWIENKEFVQTDSNEQFPLVEASSFSLSQNKGIGNSGFIFGQTQRTFMKSLSKLDKVFQKN